MELGLPVKVHNLRAEQIGPPQTGGVEVVTARAFASLETILALAEPYLQRGAEAVLPRGRTYSREVEMINRARYRVSIDLDPAQSDGALVKIRERF
jgi:16S rRNA (guanine527-N7)-methyltransferase